MVLLSTLLWLPLLAAFPAYIIGRLSARVTRLYSFAVSLAVLFLALYVYGLVLQSDNAGQFQFVEGPIAWVPQLPGIEYHLGIDGLSGPLVLVSAFLTVLVVLGSWDLIREREAEYYFLILFFEGVILGVFLSLNLLLFYVFWELVLIPMFFFIGVWGGPRRRYAAMKFLLFTFVGSTIMLLGFLGLYLFLTPGTFNMVLLRQLAELHRIPFWLQTLAAVATFVGFGVKLPVVPFHTWLPDAHVEAPAPISVFLAGLLLKMGGYGFLRVNLGLLPEASTAFAWVFIGIGLVTMFYGAIVAMIARDLKRMIALTSINHMGFVVLGAYAGMVAASPFSARLGIAGAIFQMFNHAAAIGILFMLSGYVHEQAGTREIPVLRGLKLTMPRTALLLMLGSLAGMGVPIFSNFLSEASVILGAIGASPTYWVAVFVPGITAGYFLWMLRRTVLSTPEVALPMRDMSWFSAVTLAVYLVPLLVTLVFPGLVLNVANPVADALFRVGRGS